MTAISGPVWDEERNGWQHPGGPFIKAEIAGGRDLPDQAGRAAPFGIAYEVDGELTDYACTCDVDLFKTHDGRVIVRTRMPNRDDPCPLKGHDVPETTRPEE